MTPTPHLVLPPTNTPAAALDNLQPDEPSLAPLVNVPITPATIDLPDFRSVIANQQFNFVKAAYLVEQNTVLRLTDSPSPDVDRGVGAFWAREPKYVGAGFTTYDPCLQPLTSKMAWCIR